MINARTHRRPVDRLDPALLLDFTRFYADEVRAGRYSYELDAEHRWHQRIYRDQRLDVWLITWLPTQGTQLHDHGGSSGAFTVIAGELCEAVHARHGLVESVRPAGDGVGFGAHYVHDVRNLSDAPAVSIHAYSTPLERMSYYDLDGTHLVHLATLETDDPETELPALDRRAS